VKTKDTTVLKNFYTALYHTRLMPFLFSDADGSYRGMDGELHVSSTPKFSAYSLWDTYRSWLPLMTLIDKKAVTKWSYDLLQQGKEGGILPKWTLNSNYTGTMVGYPATAFIADAMVKNLLDSIPQEFLDVSFKSSRWNAEFHEKWKGTRAENVMHKSIFYKDSLGFVPADLINESVSYGLEMAFYDWCIAQMANRLNQIDIRDAYLTKAKAYQDYFDPDLGFMRGKLANGAWRAGFDPNYSEHIDGEFVEGNSWQWTPFVPHDPEGLAQLMGGPSQFGDWLDELFSTSSEITGENASMDISGLIGQYAHGNEPSHHIPYLYQFTDRPWRTQEVLDQILNEFYLPTPEGIIGNEDCGQMSAWYVLNALGIYQLSPANKTFYIGRPLVEEAIIRLPEGTFTITVENQSRENKYIAAVYLNDTLKASKILNYEEIAAGNRLRVVMARSPSKSQN
jgi:predicted alpha-1,2-mannosidase